VSRIAMVVAASLLLAGVETARADGYLESGYRLTRFLSLAWEPAMPLEGFRDYVEDPSARGGQFDLRFGVVRHLSLGLSSSWHWFAQNFDQKTVEYPDAAVTAAVYDRAQFITLRATLHWYLIDGTVQPYVGVGAGGVWYDAHRTVAGASETWSGFSFAGDPQVGLLWTIGPGLALHLAARYQFTLASFAGVENASYAVVSAGIAVY